MQKNIRNFGVESEKRYNRWLSGHFFFPQSIIIIHAAALKKITLSLLQKAAAEYSFYPTEN